MKEGAPEDRLVRGRLGRLRERRLGRGARRGRRARRGGCRIHVDIQSSSRRRTTDDGRRTTDDGRRTTDDGRRTTDDGRQTTDDGRRALALVDRRLNTETRPK
jgi:hypothetical protein